MTQATQRPGYLDVPRHPQFDLYWNGDEALGVPEHQNLCCKFARAAARKLKGDWRDYLGTVVLLFNKSLHTYDPKVGTFAKYFGNFCVRHVIHYFARKDSMSTELSFQHVSSGRRCHLRAVFRVEEWSAELGREEPAPDEAADWDELVAPLNRQERRVVELRYRDDCSYEEIGRKVGRSRGAVNQLLFKARTKIREAT